MIKSVMKKIGTNVSVYSKDGEKMGETFGRIKLYKQADKVNYKERLCDVGLINTDTYIFVGSGEMGGAHIKDDCIIKHDSGSYVVIRHDFSQLNSVNVVWAAMKKVGD